jgi:hypothetical protein
MNKQRNKDQQYYLIAQNRNGLIELGIKGQQLRLRRKAQEVLADSKLLEGLSAEEINIINMVANLEKKKKSKKQDP